MGIESKQPIEQKNSGMKQEAWWMPALAGFARMSVWIIPPVLIGAIIGNWLGKKYGHSQLFLLLCMAISFTISIIGVAREASIQFKKIEKENGRDIQNKEDNKQ